MEFKFKTLTSAYDLDMHLTSSLREDRFFEFAFH